MVMNNSRKFLGKKGFNQSPVEFVNALIEPQSMDLKLVAREASQSAEKLQIRILQPTMNFFPSLNGDEEARAVIVGSILENGLLKPSEEVIDATLSFLCRLHWIRYGKLGEGCIYGPLRKGLRQGIEIIRMKKRISSQ
ncbi:hypothetical protein GOBAR_AA27974 [Gossypium barbadense]|uniref:Uncharacterized protein n=1 Tax=Gossypium barbadense TaxID=3634 RepID=A0A2P5WNN7_GOSBA|nr:hypothetical protein GOBAR_AA27974 [Gossypium barbadense]